MLLAFLCKNGTFFVTSFSETRAVIRVSGQFFETWLKLWAVSSEFVKIRVPARKIKNVRKKCCRKSMNFCQKNHRKSTSFKKVNFEQYFCASFQFLSRFQDFWNRKICFFASQKILTRYVYFFACKFPSQIRAGNPLWLFTTGETRPNYWTWWI